MLLSDPSTGFLQGVEAQAARNRRLIDDLPFKLLQRDPERRLGMPESGRGDIKDHGFFYGINWSQVEKKQLTPQFRPFNVSNAFPF